MCSEETEFKLNLGKAFDGTVRRHFYNPETIVLDENITIIPSDKEFAGSQSVTDKILDNCVVVYTNAPKIK